MFCIKKGILFFVCLLFLNSLCLYSQGKDRIEIKVLKGEKVVFGKWGDKLGEFGIQWEDEKDFPYWGPENQPAIDKEGNIYIYDILNKKVSKFSNKGKFLHSFILNEEHLQRLKMMKIKIDREENLYIGNLIFNKSLELVKEINVDFACKRGPFILMGISEGNHLLIKDVHNQIQYIVGRDGGILKRGEPHKIFTPINGKDYSVSSGQRKGPDRKDFILKIYDSRSRNKLQESVFLLEDSLISNVKPQRLIPIKVSKSGNIIVVGMRRKGNCDFFIFYIDEERAKIVKAYILPSNPNPYIDDLPPVFGLDGNIYQSGYSAKEEDPEYGGYWVKRYIIPDEDKPR